MSDINLNLTREEAQTILDALAGQPYAKVFNLIPKLMQQAQPQGPQAVAEDAETVPSETAVN